MSGPPVGGRTRITQRYVRHFNLINFVPFDNQSLQRVFITVVDWFLRGGGFGGKIPVYLEPIAAVLSKKSRRPVQLVMSRTDVFDASGPAPGGKVIVKIGVDKNGKMLAGYADIRLEAGGYPEAFIEAAAKCVFSCYDIFKKNLSSFIDSISLGRA